MLKDPDNGRETMAIWKVVNQAPLALIRFYRAFISPLFPPSCRFHPTCSAYAVEAFETHNFFKASWLSVWRILRCNPFSKGGYDPVPPAGGVPGTNEDKSING